MLVIRGRYDLTFPWNTQTNTWHVGQKFPITADLCDDVYFVQADGDELLHIKARTFGLQGFPQHGGLVIAWYGDHARFIARMLAND